MPNATRRIEEHIKLGLLPMSGEIVKHRQFVNGVGSSYVSINLNHVLPPDFDVVVEMLRSEMEGVTKDFEETKQLIS